MPRSKRHVRASGVARSLGAGGGEMYVCDNCRRRLPRDGIAYISSFLLDDGKPIVFCGKCWYFIEPVLDTYLKHLRQTREVE
jgi:hypothetical protein